LVGWKGFDEDEAVEEDEGDEMGLGLAQSGFA
jgi:hypothetical protein